MKIDVLLMEWIPTARALRGVGQTEAEGEVRIPKYYENYTQDKDEQPKTRCQPATFGRNHVSGNINGAGGGIRTHEGLRHRVLSPGQAYERAFCPLDLALVPPQSRGSGLDQDHGRIKTTLRPTPPLSLSQDLATIKVGPPRAELEQRGAEDKESQSCSLNPDQRRTSPDQ